MILTLCRNVLLTLIIEGAAMVAITRSRKMLGYSILANLLTCPLLNLLVLICSSFAPVALTWTVVALLEVAAVLVEAAVYHMLARKPYKYCFFLSLALNALSFGLGFVLQFLIL
jgi:hypothetical protein